MTLTVCRNLFILCICVGSICFSQSIHAEDLLSFPRNIEEGVIQKVIRADTVLLESGEKIRLIGLKAPNPPKKIPIQTDSSGVPLERDEPPTTTIEERAIQFATSLLEGKSVQLEFDAEKKDVDDYTLAYLFLEDGTFANTEILKEGFANLKITPPNTKYVEQLRAAYKDARAEKRGLQGE